MPGLASIRTTAVLFQRWCALYQNKIGAEAACSSHVQQGADMSGRAEMTAERAWDGRGVQERPAVAAVQGRDQHPVASGSR